MPSSVEAPPTRRRSSVDSHGPRRSRWVVAGDPSAPALALFAVRLEHIVSQVSSDEPAEDGEAERDPVRDFWRATSNNAHLPPRIEEESIDFFISHTWQPSASPDGELVDADKYASQKIKMLRDFGVAHSVFDCHDGPMPLPYFLREGSDASSDDDFEEAWGDRLCWVDRACTVPPPPYALPSAGGLSSAECVLVTQAALRAAGTLVVMLTPAYFSRLWCAFEFASFVELAAPDYRRIDLALTEEARDPPAWSQLVGSAAGFSLAALRTSSEGDHPELWRALEGLVVSTPGFERYMQATFLSLLAQHVLSMCCKSCPAFGSVHGGDALLSGVTEALGKLKLRGLARVISAARPQTWWQAALRTVRTQEAESAPGKSGETEEEPHDDPLDRLARLIEAKFISAADKNVGPQLPDPKTAAEFVMRALGEEGQARAREYAALGEFLNRVGRQPGQRATEPDTPRHDRQSFSEPRVVTNVTYPAMLDSAERLSCAERFSYAAFSETCEHFPPVPDQGALDAGPSPRAAPNFELRAGNAFNGRQLRGVPEGFTAFMAGLQGKALDEEALTNARLFFQTWLVYRARVDRWFDRCVAPQLERWRQRGLRRRGAVQEAFAAAFVTIEAGLRDALCSRLAPGFRESALVREAPPRGRPERSLHAPWSNPTFDRLLVVSRQIQRAGGATAADAGEDRAAEPAVVASPLQVKLVEPPQHMLLSVHPQEAQAPRRALVVKKLGANALTTAFKHMGSNAGGCHIDVLVPQMALEVVGSGGVRVVIGTRAHGQLKDSRPGIGRFRRRPGLGPQAQEAAQKAEESARADEIANMGSAIDWSMWRRVDAKDKPEAECAEEKVALEGIEPLPAALRLNNAIVPTWGTDDWGCLEVGSFGVNMSDTARSWRAIAPVRTDLLVAVRDAVGAPRTTNPRNGGPGGLLPKSAQPSPRLLPRIDDAKVVIAKKLDAASVNARKRGLSKLKASADFRLPELAASAETHRAAGATPPVGQSPASVSSLRLTQLLPSLPEQRQPPPNPTAPTTERRLQWSLAAEGGAPVNGSVWVGTPPDIFCDFMRWVRRANFAHWTPLEAATDVCEHRLECRHGDNGRIEVHFSSKQKLQKPFDEHPDDGTQNQIDPLARSPPCAECGHTDVAKVPLEHSMLGHIWKTNACVICLRCGHLACSPDIDCDTAASKYTAIAGDVVLEVSSTLLMNPGRADFLQRLASRILRVEAGQVSVSAPERHAIARVGLKAKSRVGYISFSTRDAGICAAVAVLKEALNCGKQNAIGKPFVQDRGWVYDCLRESGLDRVYGDVRPIPIDIALGDIDDQRMLPRRQNVSPLVLWAELRYVMSTDFNMLRWNEAVVQVVANGNFSLPAALAMRWSVDKLRLELGLARPGTGEVLSRKHLDTWPLAIHRVLVAQEDDVNAVLGTMLRRVGIDVASPAELCAQGFAALERECGGEHEAETSLAALTASADDATAIMRDLAYRKMCDGSVAARTFRLTMRARRQLRKIQVSRFLTDLNGLLNMIDVANSEAVRALLMNDREDYEEMAMDATDEQVPLDSPRVDQSQAEPRGYFDESDSDSGVESDTSRPAAQSEGAANFGRGVTHFGRGEMHLVVQKVLGHAKEYVHHKEVILKALEALRTVVKTMTRFHNAVGGASKRRAVVDNDGKKLGSAAPVLQIVLNDGFVRMAVRALYRHPGIPEIGAAALDLLLFLVNESTADECRKRVCDELSHPPERVLTLVMGASRFSERGFTTPLRDCLKVINAIIPCVSEGPVPPLPHGREVEVAEYALNVFTRHTGDEQLFVTSLNMLVGLCRDRSMGIALFEVGVCEALRRWLTESASGEVLNRWRASNSATADTIMFGPSGRGAQALKQVSEALVAMREHIHQCERQIWKLLTSLAVDCTQAHQQDKAAERVGRRRRSSRGSTSRGSVAVAGAQAEYVYKPSNLMELIERDTALTVRQATGEMKRKPRGTQWESAVSCLTALVTCDRKMHCKRVLDAGALPLLLNELHGRGAPVALPLLRTLIDAQGPPPPGEPVPGESRTPTNKSGAAAKGLVASAALVPQTQPPTERLSQGWQQQQQPQAHDHEEDEEPPWHAARAWLAAHGGVARILDAVEIHAGVPELQGGLLRVLGEAMSHAGAVSTAVVNEFEGRQEQDSKAKKLPKAQAGEEGSRRQPGAGVGTVTRAIRRNLGRGSVIAGGLHALCSGLKLSGSLAADWGTVSDVLDVLVDIIWAYLDQSADLRRRSIMLLTKIREGVPHLTETMVQLWDKRKAEFVEKWMAQGLEALERHENSERSPLPEFKSEMTANREASASASLSSSAGESEQLDVQDGGNNGAEEAPEGDEGEDCCEVAAKEEEEGNETRLGGAGYASEAAEKAPEVKEAPADKPEVADVAGMPGEGTAEASSVRPPAQTAKVLNGLPGEVWRFNAYLKVYDFFLSQRRHELQDVVQAMQDNRNDQEICFVALQGLMVGGEEAVAARLPVLLKTPGMIPTLYHVVLTFPIIEVSLLAMKLSTRMQEVRVRANLHLEFSQPEELEEVVVVSILGVLDKAPYWTPKEWEAVLEAVNSLAGEHGTDTGQRLMERSGILVNLADEWENIQALAKEDPVAREVLKAFQEDTERILKI